MKVILGKKVGMTQIFTEEGVSIPVTVLEAAPSVITQVKTVKTDGYNAVQFGTVDAKESRVNKPLKGHFAKAKIAPKKYVAEVRIDNPKDFKLKQEITVSDFEVGKKVDVSGTSKGKGTQGPVKRHGHKIGPKSHGSKYHRGAGSLGASSYPARVFKGMKGAGRMGATTITVQNVEVVKTIPEKNIILLKGAVPGPKGGMLRIQEAVKAQNK